MLVVYGKRIIYDHPGGPASLFTSLPITGAAATEGMGPPVELRAAGGFWQCLLLNSNAAQEVEPQPVSEVMGAAVEQAAGEAGAEDEGTPPDPLDSPASALAFSPLPAPAAAADGFDAPGPLSDERSSVPHALPAVLPPAGQECQLPADFIQAYGIQSTQVLTTRQAPAWWVSELQLRHVVRSKHDPSMFCSSFKGLNCHVFERRNHMDNSMICRTA
jgi:hypothetical protein